MSARQFVRRPRPPELAVECPWCRARPDWRCTDQRGRQLAASHPSRADAAAARREPA